MIVRVSYADLDPLDAEMLLNGCGPEGGPHLNPFGPAGLDACNRHDFDYRVGGPLDMPDSEDSTWRRDADLAFYARLNYAASNKPFWCRWWYQWTAWAYYQLVDRWGKAAFRYRFPPYPIVDLELLRHEESCRQKIEGRAGVSPLACCHILKNGGAYDGQKQQE